MYDTNKELSNEDYLPPFSLYENLLQQVQDKGYFAKTYEPFLITFLFTCLGLGTSAYIITVTDLLWVQILNGFLAGFFSVQLGLLGHDLSHKSVFINNKLNKLAASLVWGVGCGLSESRWFDKHNAHHTAPNHIGHDPDVEIPFVFSDTQILSLSDFHKRYLLPHQHILFWIGIWFVYPRNILFSMQHLLYRPTWSSVVEIIYILLHFVIVLSFTFWFLPPLVAVLFNMSVMFFVGIYMALIFAPNQKGEKMLKSEETHNWIHQITLTRNITPSAFTSYIFGGLNYQIEHHLFPAMPRFNYPQAQKIVQSFCTTHHIPYKETTWIDSLKQIHIALKEKAIGN